MAKVKKKKKKKKNNVEADVLSPVKA